MNTYSKLRLNILLLISNVSISAALSLPSLVTILKAACGTPRGLVNRYVEFIENISYLITGSICCVRVLIRVGQIVIKTI